VGDRSQDVWIAAILATLLGVLNALFLSKIMSLFSGQTVCSYFTGLGSKFFARIIGMIIIVFVVSVTILSLRDFADLMVAAFFPETPLLVFIVGLALLAAWSAWHGIEVIARMTQFLLPLTVVGVLAVGLLSMTDINLKNFLPLIEDGYTPIIRGAFTHWAFFGDVVIWFLLLPFLNKSARGYTFIPLSIVISGGLLVAVVFFIINGLGAGISAYRTYPYLSLVDKISISGFFDNAKPFFLIVWIFTNFMKINLFFYAATSGISEYFRIKSTIVIPVLAGGAVVLSVVLFDSYISLKTLFGPEYYASVLVIIQIILPVAMLVGWFIKGRSVRTS
jgi:spore germination protein KB